MIVNDSAKWAHHSKSHNRKTRQKAESYNVDYSISTYMGRFRTYFASIFRFEVEVRTMIRVIFVIEA